MSNSASRTMVDLRSDTVTQPTAGMRAAMAAAPLGDDVFGDDPSVNALQEQDRRAAGLRGGAVRADRHAEQPVRDPVALPARRRVHRRPDAHCYRWEGGGAAVFGSVQPQPLDHQPRRHAGAGRHRGRDQARRSAFRAHPAAGAGEHAGRQAAAASTYLAAGHARSRSARGWPRHLDGARLFNAAVAQAAATGQRRAQPRRAASPAASTACRCASARAWARRSARRCAARASSSRGPAASARWPAAACARPACWPRPRAYALDHHVERLADDHALARRLAAGPAGHRRPAGRGAADQHRCSST